MSKSSRSAVRKGVLFVLAMVAVAMFATYASSSKGAEPEPFVWRNAGDNPFASSEEEAMARREEAFRRLKFSEEQIQHFISETNKPAAVVQIHSGETLGGMVGGHEKVYFLFPVDFVRQKPTMPVSAEAKMWRIEWEGKMYIIYLPLICRNWAFKIEPMMCATIEIHGALPGDELAFSFVTEGGRRHKPSACSMVCDGPDCTALPTPCDDCTWVGTLSQVPDGYVPAHTGKYTVKNGGLQTISGPLEIMQEYFGACITRDGTQSNGVLVSPEPGGAGWKNNRAVIPQGLAW
jgi:hypothetical protein